MLAAVQDPSPSTPPMPPPQEYLAATMLAAAEDPPPSPSTPPLIPSLPDDVAVNCLARVPIHHHRTLSAVSRPFRSLIASPVFFAARYLAGSAEPLLFLSLRSHPSNPWFALHQNDAVQTLPPIPGPSPVGAAIAALGPEIYLLGGSLNDRPSRHVWILDCRSATWRRGPAMRTSHEFAAAGAVSGKIYVLGGCVPGARHWAEALDSETGRWRSVPSPVGVRDRWMHASAVVDQKIFAVADRGGIVFDPERGLWDTVGAELDMGWRGRACVVDGILFCYDYLGKIRGFFGGEWRELKGVERGLPRFLCGATMADLGGRLAVVWEEKGRGRGKEVEIWVAEIDVRRSGNGELAGTLRWSRKVLQAPAGSSIVHCLAVSL